MDCGSVPVALSGAALRIGLEGLEFRVWHLPLWVQRVGPGCLHKFHALFRRLYDQDCFASILGSSVIPASIFHFILLSRRNLPRITMCNYIITTCNYIASIGDLLVQKTAKITIGKNFSRTHIGQHPRQGSRQILSYRVLELQWNVTKGVPNISWAAAFYILQGACAGDLCEVYPFCRPKP